MNALDLGKYFGPKPGGRGFYVFDTEPCDMCGNEMMAPNPINVIEPREKLEGLGYTFKDPVPDEGCLEDDGDVVCSDCWS